FLHFETEGLELRVQALPDIDFDGFHITLKLQFGVHDQQLDLLSWLSDIDAAINSLKFGGIQNAFSDKVIFTYTFQGKDGKIVVPALTKDLDKILRLQLASEFINIALSVNVNNLPDGLVRDGIKDVLFQKILDRLNDADARRALNRMA